MLISKDNLYSFSANCFWSGLLLWCFSSCPSSSPLPLCPSRGVCLDVPLAHCPGTFGEAQMRLQSKILLWLVESLPAAGKTLHFIAKSKKKERAVGGGLI